MVGTLARLYGKTHRLRWRFFLPEAFFVFGWQRHTFRKANPFWRVWWFWAYRGPFQIDWWLKRKALS